MPNNLAQVCNDQAYQAESLSTLLSLSVKYSRLAFHGEDQYVPFTTETLTDEYSGQCISAVECEECTTL